MDQGIGKRLVKELFKFYKEEEIRNVFTSARWDSQIAGGVGAALFGFVFCQKGKGK
jgi:hypothetical protein